MHKNVIVYYLIAGIMLFKTIIMITNKDLKEIEAILMNSDLTDINIKEKMVEEAIDMIAEMILMKENNQEINIIMKEEEEREEKDFRKDRKVQ